MKKASINTPLRVPNDGALGRSSTGSLSKGRPSTVKGARPSIASVMRRSSIHENRKEQRLQIDRQVNNKNLKSLLTLLAALAYPQPLNMKNMVSPSTKDVLSILTFLLSRLSITYLTGKKLEDEFPRILKLLRFPYTITKHQLQPIGSMHNWPTIVYALLWIGNLIKYHKCNKKEHIVINSGNMDAQAKLAELQLHQNAYRHFMEDTSLDDLDKIDQEFLAKLPSLCGVDDLQPLNDKNNELAAKIEELNKELEEQKVLQQRATESETDTENIKDYLKKMEVYMSNLQQAKLKLLHDSEELKKEISNINAEIEQKAAIVANQKITVQEMHHFKAVIESLESEAREKEEVLSELQNEVLASETELLKEQKEVYAAIEEYHSTAHKCKLIPASASNSQGFDYAIHRELLGTGNSSSNIDKIKCRLKVVEQQWKEEARVVRNKEMNILGDVQKFRAILSSKHEELADVEAKLRRNHESKTILEQVNSTEMQKLRTELAEEEKEIEKLKQNIACANDAKEYQKTVTELHAELQGLEEYRQNRATEVDQFLYRYCEIVANHKIAVEKKLVEFEEELTRQCEENSALKFKIDFEELNKKKIRLEELEHEINAMILAASSEERQPFESR